MSVSFPPKAFPSSTNLRFLQRIAYTLKSSRAVCCSVQDMSENAEKGDLKSRDSEAVSEELNRVSSDAAARKRERPPLRYTEDFQTPSSIALDVIGVVHSPYKERFGTPRQPCITENTLGNKAQPATIELYKGSRFELGLRGLAEFEYCWVVSFFHLNQGFNPLVTPPRGPRKKQGVFATRSPHRPNSIGLSCIRITDVDEKKGLIRLLGVDLLDGTAVLDIKPYVPYCDAYPDARAGWLDRLNEDMKAPDSLNYYPPPAHLMRQLSPSDKPQEVGNVAAVTQMMPGSSTGNDISDQGTNVASKRQTIYPSNKECSTFRSST